MKNLEMYFEVCHVCTMKVVMKNKQVFGEVREERGFACADYAQYIFQFAITGA